MISSEENLDQLRVLNCENCTRVLSSWKECSRKFKKILSEFHRNMEIMENVVSETSLHKVKLEVELEEDCMPNELNTSIGVSGGGKVENKPMESDNIKDEKSAEDSPGESLVEAICEQFEKKDETDTDMNGYRTMETSHANLVEGAEYLTDQSAQANENKVFYCNECPETYSDISYLKKHKKIHISRNKLFICHICPKSYSFSSSLRKHIRTHSDKKTFFCNKCDETFPSISNMKKHRKHHTEEKSFICHICSKAFRKSNDLTSHVRRHTGEKPYVCEFCDRTYALKSSLKDHISAQHISEGIHSCPFCVQSFSRMRVLRRHIQANHMEQVRNKNMQDINDFINDKIVASKKLNECFEDDSDDNYIDCSLLLQVETREEDTGVNDDVENAEIKNLYVNHNDIKNDSDYVNDEDYVSQNNDDLTYNAGYVNTNEHVNNDEDVNDDYDDSSADDSQPVVVDPSQMFTGDEEDESEEELITQKEDHHSGVHNSIIQNKQNLVINTLDSQTGPPFQCDLCPKTFTRRHDMKRHMNNIHSDNRVVFKINDKPKLYTCDICDKSFVHKPSLFRHKKSHEVDEILIVDHEADSTLIGGFVKSAKN